MKSLILAATLSALATSALAQSSAPAPAAGTPAQQAQKVSAATQQFVQNAAITDMFEIKSGDLVQQKAMSDEYKQFGRMIRDDHTKTSDQLKSITKNLPGLQLPTDVDAAHKQKLDKLQSLSDAAFATQFRKDQRQGHKQAVKMFQDYAQQGDQADVKKFAQDTLPTLKEHQKQARALPKPAAPQTMGSAPSGKDNKKR